jgi:dCMP deaminase
MNYCLSLASCSPCSRRQYGAVLIDPERNQIIAEGYNGGPRGSKLGDLCGGNICLRTVQQIESGTSIEIGCHHAEMNLICNVAASNASARDAWLFVNGEPCIMCAKLIAQAGIVKVITIRGGYTDNNGIHYLQQNNVDVMYIETSISTDAG